MTPKEVLAQIRQREVTTVDLRFMDFPGVWQHFSIPADALTEETFEEGHRLRRLERRRLAGDQRGRPAGRPAARDGADRPVHGAADPDDDLQHPGSDHPSGLHPRPPQHRPQGRQLHAEHRAGRSTACWPRARVLRLRRRPVRPARARGVLPRRFGRRDVEPRPGRAAQPGLQAGLGAGLLPLSAHRQPGRPPLRDGPADGRVRHRDVGPLPRGRHRRPVRDRPGPPAAGRERRPGHAGQVHHSQRRPPQRQDGHVHAQAALRRQRLGHAHPLDALEGRVSRSWPATATPA